MASVRQVFTNLFLMTTVAVTFLHLIIWYPSYTNPLDNITLAKNALEKSWLNEDDVVEEYLRECIPTEREYWKLSGVRFIEKHPKWVVVMTNPPSYELGYIQGYHEPVLVYRNFYIYKHVPDSRPLGKNWVIYGFIDAYGKIIIIKHVNVEYIYVQN